MRCKAGGECRLGAEVERILVEDGRAVGVELVRNGLRSIERAAHVICDIGLTNTLALLDPDLAPAWRARLLASRPAWAMSRSTWALRAIRHRRVRAILGWRPAAARWVF